MARASLGGNLRFKSVTLEKTYGNVSIDSFAMAGDEEGVAVELPKMEINYAGITELNQSGLGKPKIKKFAMYNLQSVEADSAFERASGYNNSTYRSVLFPKLEIVKGDHAFDHAWYCCKNIEEWDMHSLKEVSGYNCFYYAFYEMDNNLSTVNYSIDLDKLERIGDLEKEPEEDNQVCCKTFYYCNKVTELKLSSLKSIHGNFACSEMFSNCSSLTTYPGWNNVEEIIGDKACYRMFYYCPKFSVSDVVNKSFTFPKLRRLIGNSIFSSMHSTSGDTYKYARFDCPLLEEIKGESILGQPFGNSTYFTYLNVPSLRTIEGKYCFNGKMQISGTANLPSLETIKGDYAIQNLFSSASISVFNCPELVSIEGKYALQTVCNNNQLKTIHLEKLKKISGVQVFAQAFALKSSVSVVTDPVYFNALDTIEDDWVSGTYYSPFQNMFNYRQNVDVYMPALKSTSFGTGTYNYSGNSNPFYNFFGANASNCTLHLPSNLQSAALGSMTFGDVVMSGTNNVIAFDLDPTE